MTTPRLWNSIFEVCLILALTGAICYIVYDDYQQVPIKTQHHEATRVFVCASFVFDKFETLCTSASSGNSIPIPQGAKAIRVYWAEEGDLNHWSSPVIIGDDAK